MNSASMNLKSSAGLHETIGQLLLAIGGREKGARELLAGNPDFLRAMLALAAPLPTDGTPYSRKVIYTGPLGDAMVAHWPAGATCLPHDHGGAHGLVTVLQGDFFEQSYRPGKHFKAHGSEQRFAEGDIESVIPSEVHSLRAVTEGVTLHLYSPAIKGMKVYDQETRTVFTVADNCGAWIPADERLIALREAFGADPLHD